MDPFFCMYWSEEQRLMYKESHKKNKDCFLTIDATGSIGKALRLPNGEKSQHIFLYQVVCVSDVGNFPVFQMVSAKQHASMISFFLSEIIRNGAPVPRMVVSDFGKAILIAVARIFAGCSNLSHYLQICYDILQHERDQPIPSCYIRLDVSHFISMIARWACLKGKATKIRQFFIRCLGQAYQMENFTEFEKHIQSVLIVALSEEIGLNDDYVPLQSEVHLQRLNDKIKGVNIDEEQAVEEIFNYEEEMDAQNEDQTWSIWGERMYNEALEIAQMSSTGGTVVNAFYNVQAAKQIKRLLSYAPLWTGIMRSHFQTGREIATSSFVEAEFAQLKTRVFKDKLPMRIDKFTLCHIDYLDGRLKLACSTRNEKTVPNTPETTSNRDSTTDINETDIVMPPLVDDYCESLNEIENWRSKIKVEKTQHDSKETVSVENVYTENKSDSKKRRQNYLTPCPDWDFVQSTKAVGVPLMKNGSLCKAVLLNKEYIVVTETCAFDSLLQVVASATGMRNTYKAIVSDLVSTNLFYQLVLSILQSGKILSKHYSIRAKILCDMPIFKKVTWKLRTRDIPTLNGNCNAANLAECLFQDVPSYTLSYTCQQCTKKYEKSYAILNINIKIILHNGLGALQQAVNDMTMGQTTTCRMCNQQTTYVCSYGPHLIIDTCAVTDKSYLKSINVEQVNFTVDSTKKLIQVDNIDYSLAGIISYTKTGPSDNEGHYTAFTYTGLTWYKYDDMVSKRTTVSATHNIYPHVLIYVKS